MLSTLVERAKEVNRLGKIFEPYLVFGEEYHICDKKVRACSLRNDAPQEAIKAYEEFERIVGENNA